MIDRNKKGGAGARGWMDGYRTEGRDNGYGSKECGLCEVKRDTHEEQRGKRYQVVSEGSINR